LNEIMSKTRPRAAYVHVPFCKHRCGYCNFTLVAGRDDLIDAYLEAIERELSWLDRPREVGTLFFGGGTPTHLPPEKLRRLIEIVLHWFPLTAGYEFSVEANPADLDSEQIGVLHEQGVNRLSLGAQSFDMAKLRRLDRDHDAAGIARSVDLARTVMKSISLDLIFGVPGESLDLWEADLAAALKLRPDHISTYGLTYERGTTLWSSWKKGQVRPLGEELERAMFERGIDVLTGDGFEHYEVSNFARPRHRCRHNEAYWSGDEYYAVGPGAARYVNGRREMNHRSTTTYINRVLAGQSPVADSEELSPEDRALELFVFGMRRLEGVDRTEFVTRTSFELDRLVGHELRRFIARGLLEDVGDRVRLTREGLFVSDSIWPHFLDV
jgi:oxygen-independent coproporphyrinogen-3 oxidase